MKHKALNVGQRAARGREKNFEVTQADRFFKQTRYLTEPSGANVCLGERKDLPDLSPGGWSGDISIEIGADIGFILEPGQGFFFGIGCFRLGESFVTPAEVPSESPTVICFIIR